MKNSIRILAPVRFKVLRRGKFNLCFIAVLLLVFAVACIKGEDEPIPEPSFVAVSSVSINNISVVLSIGETVRLFATISPENATDKTINWISSDTNVATVTNGKVTAVASGSAVITAQAGNYFAECLVTVRSVKVTSVTLNKSSVMLSVGEAVDLIATVTPENAADKTVKWTSSNKNVATVSNGKVTAVAAGSAVITAQAGNYFAECSVTVRYIEVTSITLNKSSVVLSIGEAVDLIATVTPENAADKTVKWTSSNKNVATVSNGKITAVAAGSAIITAQSNNGYSDTCYIVVVDKPEAGGSEGTEDEEW